MGMLAPRPHTPEAAADQRLALRHGVEMTRAGLRAHGDVPWDVALLDISIFGCRLSGTYEVESGDRVWLKLSGGMAVGASVIWRRDDVLGCRFDVPIARALMRALVLGIA